MAEKKYYDTWYGEKVSDYGLQQGYVDYHCLASTFNHILCNDITKTEHWEYAELKSELNSEAIDHLEEAIDYLDLAMSECEDADMDDLTEEIDKIRDVIEYRKAELKSESDREVFQYYLIDKYGADLLLNQTKELVWYLEDLDIYVWGITHYGTSSDYVLTDIKLEEKKDD